MQEKNAEAAKDSTGDGKNVLKCVSSAQNLLK